MDKMNGQCIYGKMLNLTNSQGDANFKMWHHFSFVGIAKLEKNDDG